VRAAPAAAGARSLPTATVSRVFARSTGAQDSACRAKRKRDGEDEFEQEPLCLRRIRYVRPKADTEKEQHGGKCCAGRDRNADDFT